MRIPVKLSTQIKAVYIAMAIMLAVFAWLAYAKGGWLIVIVSVLAPLSALAATIFSATRRCPHCRESVVSPPAGEKDANPFWYPVYGRCAHCGEKI